MSKDDIIISEDQNTITIGKKEYVFKTSDFGDDCDNCDMAFLGICCYIPCSPNVTFKRLTIESGYFKLSV